MERHWATAALVAAGFDVLLCDATVVFVRDFLPLLRAQPDEIDMLVQREPGPPSAARRLGCGLNAGFTYVRAAKNAARREAQADFYKDMCRRGLVEFYHRWNNVIDLMGWSLLVADSRSLDPKTSVLANETTVVRLQRRGCTGSDCLAVGLLPYDLFPRVGAWPPLRANGAVVHHLVGDGSLGPQFVDPEGVPRFLGHRQRLDRYDEQDFGEYVGVLKQVGLWLVDADPAVPKGM